MSRKSTNNLLKKAICLFLLLIITSLIVSISRQVLVYLGINSKLTEKENRLEELEGKNEELKAKLGEVKSPKYLEEQAREILGLSSEKGSLEAKSYEDLRVKKKRTSFYQEWLRLFVY